MQAVIMAGGKGTRLKSLTNDEIPKPMVMVAGKPILLWQVETLKDNGVDDIIMITGHLGEKITEYFGDGSLFGIPISYYQETEPLGTAGALALIQDRLQETFVLAFGDVIFDIDVMRMLEFHKKKESKLTLFVHPNSHPYDSDLVLTDASKTLTGFLRKNEPRNEYYKNLVNAGFYIVDREICKEIPSGIKTDLEKNLILEHIASKTDIFVYRSSEYIKDAGTPERIVDVEKDIENGIVRAKNLKNKQKAIFLDRDGTINVYKGLLCKKEDMELENKVSEAIKLINRSEYLAFVVTNQPVVARNMCSIEEVGKIHDRMETILGEEGAYLDDIEFCPHHPDKGYPEENPVYKVACECRKPKVGMIDSLARRYNIDLKKSWMIGDTTMDIQTGVNAGLHTVLVNTGVGGTDGKYDVIPEKQCDNLYDAVKHILGSNS
jgi:D,D-heptose 1,7-bisphosphate phosphatase